MTFKHGNCEKQQLWMWCILQCCEQWEVHIPNHVFFFPDWNGFTVTKTMSWRSVSQATKLMDWEPFNHGESTAHEYLGFNHRKKHLISISLLESVDVFDYTTCLIIAMPHDGTRPSWINRYDYDGSLTAISFLMVCEVKRSRKKWFMTHLLIIV